MIASMQKADRSRVDISTKDLARRWRKHLDKSTKEIQTAIDKVGNNAESVIKELETK